MHTVTKELQEFYDSQAEKFSNTRQRERPEFEYILIEIKKIIARIEKDSYENKSPLLQKKDKSHWASRASNTATRRLRIVDLGCGDGRLLWYLQENIDYEIEYVGVDISFELLQLANKKYPHARRIHQDMVYFLKNTPQEYFDAIVSVASFHHLPTSQDRWTALGFIYYTLAYEGSVIMTNRCYSDWFREKYKKEIRKALVKSLYTLGKSSKNDILIPRKANDWTLVANRLYHIFWYHELKNIFAQSGFAQIEQWYIKNDWSATDYERDGRNLFSVARKSIWG